MLLLKTPLIVYLVLILGLKDQSKYYFLLFQLQLPVRDGNITCEPPIGEKILLVVGALYNCALTVTSVNIRFSATTTLKNADIDVIIPSRGTEKAKFKIHLQFQLNQYLHQE